jgi:hypothetical protein
MGSMTRSAFLFIATKGVQVGHFPQRRLRAIAAPVRFASVADRKPAGLVLPMIVAAAEGKMLLRPNNLTR